MISSCPAPPDLGVRYVGRVDGCKAEGARYAWSGSGFVARFKGTAISVRLKDAVNEHTVVLDGEVLPKLVTTSGEKLYPLASDLADEEHVLELYRRSEASSGETLLLGLEVKGANGNPGELLEPPPAPVRRIEVIGDSISCGYGNEGKAPCTFSQDTENHYLAYGSVLARSVGAELSTVAWSGKGVIYNYNGDKLQPLPTVYDRTVPNDARNLWGFAWQPEAVIINLGTNDYSTAASPTDELFTSTYQRFLEHLRAKYPDAFILCTVGPMLTGSMLASARHNISAAVTARNDAGDSRVKAYEMTTQNTNPGCDSHPGLATHEAMAKELEAELKTELGW
jgi:lysophospholipase L1-like esterase